MNLLIDDIVHLTAPEELNHSTEVIGTVTGIGRLAHKPDVFWVQLEGLTTTFYLDEWVAEKIG